MSGYFKIHRSLFTSAVWLAMSHLQRVVLMTMLGMVYWKETETVLKSGKKIVLQPGQFVATVKDIENACNNGNDKSITRMVVRGTIEQLKRTGFATIARASAANNDGYVVTIVNWRLYQVEDADNNQRQNQRQNQATTNEQPICSQPTNIQEKREEGEEVYIPPYNPPNDPELSTGNSCEQAKPKRKPAEPKRQYAEFVWLTSKQYAAIVARVKTEEAAQWCINKLNGYKERSGKKYKSDYQAMQNWVFEEYERQHRSRQRLAPNQQQWQSRWQGQPRQVQPDVYEMAMKAQALLDRELSDDE